MGWICHFDTQSDAEHIGSVLNQYDGLVLRSRIAVTASLLNHAPNLRFIAREGVGLEHIDLEHAATLGIEVLYSPEGSRDTVGEHTLGMLLMLLNNLGRADRQVRAGEWLREPNRAYELKGKTVGILGYGNMGQALAMRLQGFGVEVLACDKYRQHYADAYAQEVSLQELQARAQVLSIHIPYSRSNHYFVDGTFLDAFQHPLFVVNTARGSVLHTADLVARMETGQVLGAALDVLEYEEQSFNTMLAFETRPSPFQYLIASDRTVLSPHIAGWSFESKRKHAEVLAEKIQALFADA
jgi:D-3-phosphoglycerate dehydrogenase